LEGPIPEPGVRKLSVQPILNHQNTPAWEPVVQKPKTKDPKAQRGGKLKMQSQGDNEERSLKRGNQRQREDIEVQKRKGKKNEGLGNFSLGGESFRT
jgi:hypothetical protein